MLDYMDCIFTYLYGYPTHPSILVIYAVAVVLSNVVRSFKIDGLGVTSWARLQSSLRSVSGAPALLPPRFGQLLAKISDVDVSAGGSSGMSLIQHRQGTLIILIYHWWFALKSLTKYSILYINYRCCPIADCHEFGFSWGLSIYGLRALLILPVYTPYLVLCIHQYVRGSRHELHGRNRCSRVFSQGKLCPSLSACSGISRILLIYANRRSSLHQSCSVAQWTLGASMDVTKRHSRWGLQTLPRTIARWIRVSQVPHMIWNSHPHVYR